MKCVNGHTHTHTKKEPEMRENALAKISSRLFMI